MFNFIDSFMEYTQDWESPDSFWLWSALSCISSIMRDNLYLNIQGERYYPNMYVILLSDSGEARKAMPCKTAGKLVKSVGNTKFISGRTSIQAAIKELSKAYTDENGRFIEGASALLYSEELHAFCVQDDALIPILTELYDYHDIWSSSLIGAGSIELKNVCLSLLAASNSTLFSNVYTSQAATGGLLGRTFIIREEAPRHRKSLFDLAKIQRDPTELIKHLERLSKLRGAVVPNKAAETLYNKWYYGLAKDKRSDKIGFGSRLGTHVFKVALALAGAREDFKQSLISEDIKQAIDLCTELRRNYRQLIIGSGLSSRSQQAALIIQIILKSKEQKISRKALVQGLIGDIELTTLDEILAMLVTAEFIQELAVSGEIGYKLTDEAIDQLLGG